MVSVGNRALKANDPLFDRSSESQQKPNTMSQCPNHYLTSCRHFITYHHMKKDKYRTVKYFERDNITVYCYNITVYC